MSAPFVHVLIVTFFLVGSCTKKDKLKESSGFWISVDYKNGGSFKTITVEDSFVRMNRYGVNDDIYVITQRQDTLEARYPFDSMPVAFDLVLQNDTLVQLAPHNNGLYIKIDSVVLGRKLLYPDTPLAIDLPDAGERDLSLSLDDNSLVYHFYLGYLKSGSANMFPQLGPDSIALQVEDVLIDISSIKQFLRLVQEQIDEKDYDKLVIVLHADKQTPNEIIEAVKNEIQTYNAHFIICRAYIDWEERKKIFKVI